MNRGGDQNSRCELLDALELELRSPRRGLRLSVDIREESGKLWLSMVGALVTGGARGIGAAICTALARSGHRVAVNFHRREDAANTLVAAIKREGGTAIAVAVANASSVERMVQYVEQALGPVTILVNNAALTDVHKPWQEIDEAEWDAVIAVNLKSCFLCFRAVYPAMRAVTWGRVVNISSVTFWLGRPHLVCIIASMATGRCLMKGLRDGQH